MIGNPTKWYDDTEFTWVNGRRLALASNDTTGLEIAYTYDSAGLRLTKTVGGVEHRYTWQGGKLIAEYWDGGKAMEFFYGPEQRTGKRVFLLKKRSIPGGWIFFVRRASARAVRGCRGTRPMAAPCAQVFPSR